MRSSPNSSSASAIPQPGVDAKATQPGTSVLGWPAWLRVLAVLPVLVLLWLAVRWACS